MCAQNARYAWQYTGSKRPDSICKWFLVVYNSKITIRSKEVFSVELKTREYSVFQPHRRLTGTFDSYIYSNKQRLQTLMLEKTLSPHPSFQYNPTLGTWRTQNISHKLVLWLPLQHIYTNVSFIIITRNMSSPLVPSSAPKTGVTNQHEFVCFAYL